MTRLRRARKLANYNPRAVFSDCPCLLLPGDWHDYDWHRNDVASMFLDGYPARWKRGKR